MGPPPATGPSGGRGIGETTRPPPATASAGRRWQELHLRPAARNRSIGRQGQRRKRPAHRGGRRARGVASAGTPPSRRRPSHPLPAVVSRGRHVGEATCSTGVAFGCDPAGAARLEPQPLLLAGASGLSRSVGVGARAHSQRSGERRLRISLNRACRAVSSLIHRMDMHRTPGRDACTTFVPAIQSRIGGATGLSGMRVYAWEFTVAAWPPSGGRVGRRVGPRPGVSARRHRAGSGDSYFGNAASAASALPRSANRSGTASACTSAARAFAISPRRA